MTPCKVGPYALTPFERRFLSFLLGVFAVAGLIPFLLLRLLFAPIAWGLFLRRVWSTAADRIIEKRTSNDD